MTTDRELLELAAKAYGLVFWEENDWSPLADDCLALRLAVKLCMGVQSNGPEHWQSPNCTIVLFGDHSQLTQEHNGDPAAATRRAIVRAAAAIGETL